MYSSAKKLVFTCLLLQATVGAYAQNPPRQKSSFDENWKFSFGHAANARKDFNYSISNIYFKSGKADSSAIHPQFDDSQWRSLDIPHDWAVELPFQNSKSQDVCWHGFKPVGGRFPETSIGWYRKHFNVAKADSGQRFELQFDGVFRDANVWVNGFFVGNNKSGYVGVAYDITDYINFGKENVVAVRVDASQYEGWFYEGAGIYRHVWLNRYDNLHIAHDGVFIHSQPQGANATLHIETTVENKNFDDVKATVSATITDRNGKQVGQSPEMPLSLDGNETKTIKQRIMLNRPTLWTLDEPYLYNATITVKSGGKVTDVQKMKVGVRSVNITEKGVFLNGKYIKIHGTNNHQDHAGVGSALPDYLQYYRIRLLKDMGVNAYRASHHAPTPELLEACDSLGMLVLDEQRLLNSSPEYMDQFERLIKRDRSHPSVFLWSIGNEEGYIQTNSFGKRIALSLLAKQKELDPTRTSTYAADLANHFPGINEVVPVRGFNYREYAVYAYHKDHPKQPVIGTEMGSTVSTRGIFQNDTANAYLKDQDVNAPWWASTAEKWWQLCADSSWWGGGFVWTGFDYRGEPTPFEWPNINSHFGIMDVCGFPKNIYYYYQSWWTDKDVLHISPHWNWKGKEGQPIDVWVNSNADNVELFLNGKSLGKKTMPRNGHLQWAVNYAPGKLEAIAFKKGRKLEAKIETTEEPVEVVVTPYKTTMLADGKDVAVINISVVDKMGREVPDASNLIKFVVKGDAKIIGVGNGDPSSHEPDKCADGQWQRKLFNGKAQVILQGGLKKSLIYFEANAEGLYKGSTDIHSIKPGVAHLVTSVPGTVALATTTATGIKMSDKIIGADISFLPELEAKGIHFSDKGVQKDAIEILKDHGFNYVRLRIFNNPAADSGYSPKKGFCDLAHTKLMAKRAKAAGMKLLLDFHYSDYWADPGKQYKPKAWKKQGFVKLRQSVYAYTKKVMAELKAQGTLPDMVQVGNEINHGMIWPEGHIGNLDSLAQLIEAGIEGVKAVNPSSIIMLHIALGGQADETRFFYDNMLARGLNFDVIGLSYYPKWHGTLDDLRDNLIDLERRYKKPLNVVEYTYCKKEVYDIIFNLPQGSGTGAFIWEPLNTWDQIFEKDGKSNDKINLYDEICKKYKLK